MQPWLDHFGVSVAALTGVLAARGKQVDLFGVIVLALVTAFGGGTVRDLALGSVPVFWIENSDFFINALLTAVVTFYLVRYHELPVTVLLVADAFVLALFTMAGAKKSLAFAAPPSIAIAMGVITGVVGGILRDLLAGEPSVLLRPEIYVTAALAGAAIFTFGDVAGMPPVLSDLAGFAAAFAVRGGALKFGWAFPAYKSRPGRHPDDIP